MSEEVEVSFSMIISLRFIHFRADLEVVLAGLGCWNTKNPK